MFCNWIIEFEPETVTIDPLRGPEPGVRFHVVSDWDDDFMVLAIPKNGYGPMPEWCRAEADTNELPDYFCDFLIDLADIAVENSQSGTHNYQVDLAPNRVGLETARQRWASEHPG
jgi:hypothetical protein